MTARATPIDARRSSFWFDDLPDRLEKAVGEYGFENTNDFQPLADLSAATLFEGIDVDPRTVVVAGHKWTVAGTAYVTLRYDMSSDDPVIQDDAYPLTIRFHLDDDDGVVVDGIDVDVTSFYQ